MADTPDPKSDPRSAHDRLQEVTSRALSSLPPQLQRHLKNVSFAHGTVPGVIRGNPHTIVFEHKVPLDDHTVQQLMARHGTQLAIGGLSPKVKAGVPKDDPEYPNEYGGDQGLKDLRQQGGTVLSLSPSQSASAMQYYVSQRPHVDDARGAELDSSYKPYLDEIGNLPVSTEALDPAQNIHPEATHVYDPATRSIHPVQR